MSDFLCSLKDVDLAFGGPKVLVKVSLSISRGMRAALTGRNGEGKSTLMKVIAGMIEPDDGEIVKAPGLKVEYVSQDVRASANAPGNYARPIGGAPNSQRANAITATKRSAPKI